MLSLSWSYQEEILEFLPAHDTVCMGKSGVNTTIGTQGFKLHTGFTTRVCFEESISTPAMFDEPEACYVIQMLYSFTPSDDCPKPELKRNVKVV